MRPPPDPATGFITLKAKRRAEGVCEFPLLADRSTHYNAFIVHLIGIYCISPLYSPYGAKPEDPA